MHKSLDSVNTLSKRPGEIIVLSIEFGPWIGAGESLSGTPSIPSPEGSGLVIDSIVIDGTQVQFEISGGAPRYLPWHLRCTVSTTGGSSQQTFIAQCGLLVTA